MDADVIILGSGAGGGTLVRALAPTGLKLLLIERGDFLRREKENWEPEAVFHRHRYHTDEVWFDGNGAPFKPITGYHVGGNTKLFGAAVFRRREHDFSARRHADGSTVSWPIRYGDLAPYYKVAEEWYFAHGARGQDPEDPPADGPYPFPPVSHEPAIACVYRALQVIGLHPFHLPLALRLNETDRSHSRCIRCDTCDGFPCLVQAKGDAEICGVRPALAGDNVTLETGVRATRLLSSSDGLRVIGIQVQGHRNRRTTLTARVVIVACGAVNSAALLLASHSEAHPRGLANRSDQVGRNYMCHLNSVMLGLSPTRSNPTVFQKTLGINDFYSRSGDPAFPHPLGHVQLLGKVTGAILKAQHAYLPRPFANWIARHSVDWWLTTEDLARPENRVTLTERGAIQLAYTPNNVAAHRRLLATWRNVLHRIGFPFVISQTLGIDGVAHQVGTVRFGDDPAASVLNPYCRSHEIDNLFVVDGGFMPSIAAVNPSLTIMAQALRVADYIKARFASGDWHGR